MRRAIILALLSLILLAACSGSPGPSPTPLETASPAASATPKPSQTPSPSATTTETATAAPTETPTATLTPSATPSPVPTYTTLRGEVTVAQAVCHYGPGKPYLYKYAVIGGSNLEALGRVELADGRFYKVQAIGGNNPCWLNAEYFDMKGADPLSLPPIEVDDAGLPMSPYYGPISGSSATRSGDQVTVYWPPFALRPGDDSEQVPYLIEAWVCRAGEIVFMPLGFWQPMAVITDEAGCAEPSRARLYAAEKHGYTRYITIPWPPHEGTPAVTPSPTAQE